MRYFFEETAESATKLKLRMETEINEILTVFTTGLPWFNHLAPELFFFNFSTPCIQIVNNTGNKYVRIMKRLHFEEEKTESIYYV